MGKSILKGLVGFLIAILILIYAFDLSYLVKAVRTIYLKGHTTAFIEDYTNLIIGLSKIIYLNHGLSTIITKKFRAKTFKGY